jgi:hypothetical protein
MRSNDLPSSVIMSAMFSSWVVVAWPSVGNSCVSRVVPIPLAKANSPCLGPSQYRRHSGRVIWCPNSLVPLPPLTVML